MKNDYVAMSRVDNLHNTFNSLLCNIVVSSIYSVVFLNANCVNDLVDFKYGGVVLVEKKVPCCVRGGCVYASNIEFE